MAAWKPPFFWSLEPELTEGVALGSVYMCREGIEEWVCPQIMETFEIEGKDILKAQEKCGGL